MRNSAPLWARGKDAFLVIRGTRDRSRPTALSDPDVIWTRSLKPPYWRNVDVNGNIRVWVWPWSMFTDTSDRRAAFTVQWVEILVTKCERIWGSNVTAKTRGGFMRNTTPQWARAQEAFLVIRGRWDRSRPLAIFACKVIWVPFGFKGNSLQKVSFQWQIRIRPDLNNLRDPNPTNTSDPNPVLSFNRNMSSESESRKGCRARKPNFFLLLGKGLLLKG